MPCYIRHFFHSTFKQIHTLKRAHLYVRPFVLIKTLYSFDRAAKKIVYTYNSSDNISASYLFWYGVRAHSGVRWLIFAFTISVVNKLSKFGQHQMIKFKRNKCMI